MARNDGYRVVRLSLHIPPVEGALAHYVLVATGHRKGVPTAQILVDGHLRGVSTRPTTEEILEALDAALRQQMLPG